MKKIIIILLSIALLVFVAGCATQTTEPVEDMPGFLKGLLHGFIMFFSFIVSLFTDFKIYAIPNSGIWYDLGFLLGVMFFFGGSGSGVSKKRK